MLFQPLAARPHHQQTILHETDSVIGGKDCLNRAFGKMLFTNAFKAELYRMVPEVSHITRKITASATLTGYDLPAGTNMIGFLHQRTGIPIISKIQRCSNRSDTLAAATTSKSSSVDVFSRGRQACPRKS